MVDCNRLSNFDWKPIPSIKNKRNLFNKYGLYFFYCGKKKKILTENHEKCCDILLKIIFFSIIVKLLDTRPFLRGKYNLCNTFQKIHYT